MAFVGGIYEPGAFGTGGLFRGAFVGGFFEPGALGTGGFFTEGLLPGAFFRGAFVGGILTGYRFRRPSAVEAQD